MPENLISGIKNRFLQRLAMSAPGGTGFRIGLHRLRGVQIGAGVWIGQEVLIETAYPELVSIGNKVVIGIRTTIIAHFHDIKGVRIEDDVFIGPCVTILPGVTIGRGAVAVAGSVVASSVPPMAMVQGNPACPVAKCGIPLGLRTSRKEFMSHLRQWKGATK